jgi:hypothetical protein
MSPEEVCNAALAYISQKPIQLLTDTNDINARRCNTFFKTSVELVLREFEWSSAAKRVKLARNTSDPVFERTYQYNLPADCVKIIDVYTSETWSPYNRWNILGRKIQAESDTIYLKYVSYPDDIRDLDISLADSIALRMAIRMCTLFLKDKDQFQILQVMYKEAIRMARAMDTMENKESFIPNNVYQDAQQSEGY